MNEYILPPSREESVILPGGAAQRLLRSGNGDAALLYISFLHDRGRSDAAGHCARMNWPLERFEAAAQALEGMGLLARSAAPAPESKPPEPQRVRPEYTNADLLSALERAEFSALSSAVDQALGKRLTTPDQKILLGLYDDLGLSADMIFLLVNFCIERSVLRYGEGRRPTMRQIEQEGYAWVRMELTDQERAAAYIRKYHRQREALPRMMKLLGLGDRKLSVSEEKYLAAWSDMGFEDAAIELAYDRTILKCKELKWPYMNKILTAWHEKGLHTARAIEEGDRPAAARNAAGEQLREETAQREDLARLEKYLKKLREEQGSGVQ